MNKIDGIEYKDGLVNLELDGGGDTMPQKKEYTNKWDMEIGELEIARNKIEKIL